MSCVYWALLVAVWTSEVSTTNATRNVAIGAFCCASSEYDSNYSCEKAVDDNMYTDWASAGGGARIWIHLELGGAYSLQQLRIADRWNSYEKNKDVLLTFSGESTQLITLTEHGDGLFWVAFTLDPVLTYWVKIQVKTVFTKFNNGLKEIQFFGIPASPVQSNGFPSCVSTDTGTPISAPMPGKVSGTLQPVSRLPWDTFLSNMKCITECAGNVRCLAVALNVKSNECRVIHVWCVLLNIHLNNDVVVWTPDRKSG